MHNFYFGGKWLSYFGGRITQAPQHEIPVRDVSTVEIPCRDGDVLLDNGRWKNVEFEREISFCRIYPNCQQSTLRGLLSNG